MASRPHHAARAPGTHPRRHGHDDRKQRILAQKRPSQVRSIAEAFAIKDGDLYLFTERDGQIPVEGPHGFGLYYHDCRYLAAYELRLDGRVPEALAASPDRGFKGMVELVSRAREQSDDRHAPEREELCLEWQREVDGDRPTLRDRIAVQNFGTTPVTAPVTLTFRTAFEDMLMVRGLVPDPAGRLRPPIWSDGALDFAYDGNDGLRRQVHVTFSPAPDRTSGTTGHFRVTIPPHGRRELDVRLDLAEFVQTDARPRDASTVGRPGRAATEPASPLRVLPHSARREPVEWPTDVRSDNRAFDAILSQALLDLHILRSGGKGRTFYAAGLPWFGALFGRDSLLSALQTLAFDRTMAAETLRLLADHQGRETNGWRDEEPGKILHEFRRGELALSGDVPQAPYYGTVDATPLFLILLAREAAWSGRLDLFLELGTHVDLALAWIDRAMEATGYLTYRSASTHGLINQGWKDSGDAIVNADGSLARPPIALVEVQGYVYRAKLDIAELFERAGEPARADALRAEAQALRDRFNRDFWVEATQSFALALEKDGEPVTVATSNPGQALWTGIIAPARAAATVARLMAPDLFSGWGIRTLSEQERRYNPIGYHLGTVWPHDNVLAAAGFRRYGFDREAGRVCRTLLDAATHFRERRLPEVFAGFARADFDTPVQYPVACHPQAWAAGAVPFLLETVLGLQPDAFDHRLRLVRPFLPAGTDTLDLRGLRVGGDRVDLRFARTPAQAIDVTVLEAPDDLSVVVEWDGHASADDLGAVHPPEERHHGQDRRRHSH